MGERSEGIERSHDAWAEGMQDYRPAYSRGNRRDAAEIAKRSRRPIEEFLLPDEQAKREAEQEGEAADKDAKE